MHPPAEALHLRLLHCLLTECADWCVTRQPLKWTRGNRCVRHFNKRFGVSEAAVTARQRAVAEKVEGALPDGAVEVLLIWIIEYGGMLLEPIAFVIMLIFKREFDISGLYGIREMDLLYYLFFGLIVVPAESLCDVLLLNAAERLHGWRVVAYLQRLDRRYKERSTAWVLAVADERYRLLAPHEQEDKSAATAAAPPQSDKRSDDAQESEIDPGAWKTVEQLAFSSQVRVAEGPRSSDYGLSERPRVTRRCGS